MHRGEDRERNYGEREGKMSRGGLGARAWMMASTNGFCTTESDYYPSISYYD